MLCAGFFSEMGWWGWKYQKKSVECYFFFENMQMQMMVFDLKTIFWKDHINLKVFGGKQKKYSKKLEKDTYES